MAGIEMDAFWGKQSNKPQIKHKSPKLKVGSRVVYNGKKTTVAGTQRDSYGVDVAIHNPDYPKRSKNRIIWVGSDFKLPKKGK